MTKTEIERKYIIRLPENWRQLEHCRIEQTYLCVKEGTARVRLCEQNGGKKYYFTHKMRMSDMSALEREEEIDELTYQALLSQRDPRLNTIQKTRCFYPFDGLVFEIDIYPFWQKQCIMEVELESEEQSFALPDDIVVVREVTADKRYKNVKLARHIPEEDI